MYPIGVVTYERTYLCESPTRSHALNSQLLKHTCIYMYLQLIYYVYNEIFFFLIKAMLSDSTFYIRWYYNGTSPPFCLALRPFNFKLCAEKRCFTTLIEHW